MSNEVNQKVNNISNDLNRDLSRENADIPASHQLKNTFFGSFTVLTASAIGSGMLTLPWAFMNSGLYLGLILLLFGALTCMITNIIIMWSTIVSKSSSYGDLFATAIGPTAGPLIDLLICLEMTFVVPCYFIFLGDFCGHLLRTFAAPAWICEPKFSIIASMCIIWPLCIPRKISFLSRLSLISIIALAFNGILITFLTPSFHAYNVEGSTIKPKEVHDSFSLPLSALPLLATPEGPTGSGGPVISFNFSFVALRCLGLSVFSYFNHINAVSVTNELFNPTPQRIIGLALTSSSALYFLFSILASTGYLSWLENTTESFIAAYPPSFFGAFGSLLLAGAMVLMVPLNINPLCNSLRNVILFLFCPQAYVRLMDPKTKDLTAKLLLAGRYYSHGAVFLSNIESRRSQGFLGDLPHDGQAFFQEKNSSYLPPFVAEEGKLILASNLKPVIELILLSPPPPSSSESQETSLNSSEKSVAGSFEKEFAWQPAGSRVCQDCLARLEYLPPDDLLARQILLAMNGNSSSSNIHLHNYIPPFLSERDTTHQQPCYEVELQFPCSSSHTCQGLPSLMRFLGLIPALDDDSASILMQRRVIALLAGLEASDLHSQRHDMNHHQAPPRTSVASSMSSLRETPSRTLVEGISIFRSSYSSPERLDKPIEMSISRIDCESPPTNTLSVHALLDQYPLSSIAAADVTKPYTALTTLNPLEPARMRSLLDQNVVASVFADDLLRQSSDIDKHASPSRIHACSGHSNEENIPLLGCIRNVNFPNHRPSILPDASKSISSYELESKPRVSAVSVSPSSGLTLRQNPSALHESPSMLRWRSMFRRVRGLIISNSQSEAFRVSAVSLMVILGVLQALYFPHVAFLVGLLGGTVDTLLVIVFPLIMYRNILNKNGERGIIESIIVHLLLIIFTIGCYLGVAMQIKEAI